MQFKTMWSVMQAIKDIAANRFDMLQRPFGQHRYRFFDIEVAIFDTAMNS